MDLCIPQTNFGVRRVKTSIESGIDLQLAVGDCTPNITFCYMANFSTAWMSEV